ncbi:MAG: carboxylating nicotinate-nucleotide diphosphorylase [Chloroflexota bacterium]
MVWQQELRRIVEAALAEDLGWGDATTEAIIPRDLMASGLILGREEGVLAGIEVAMAVFRCVDPSIEFDALASDSDVIRPDQAIASVRGLAASILAGERVALNFLQRLSGVATLTARYVQAVGSHRARIVDTRKTTPGLRALEKYAVVVGGGFNHRQNLSDGILIKDNHLAAMASRGFSLSEVVAAAHRHARHTQRVEVEVATVGQARDAVEAGADDIRRDNMSRDQMRQAVDLIGGRALVEASGGVNLQRVAAIAATGVDLISVGELTHSARALDIALDFVV